MAPDRNLDEVLRQLWILGTATSPVTAATATGQESWTNASDTGNAPPTPYPLREAATSTVPAADKQPAAADTLYNGTAPLIEELTDALRRQTEATTENTSTVAESSRVFASAIKGGFGSTAGKGLLSIFGGIFGASPIAALFSSLFGGGGGEEPSLSVAPSDEPYQSGYAGYARLLHQQPGAYEGIPAPPISSPAPVTIQIQAIDAQSFLDRSEDIALAVRKALLESYALNDAFFEG